MSASSDRGAETGRERMVVAMSGGVDSSVAAARAVLAGYEAIGVTMNLAGSASRCCSLEDADDARRVAEKIGIRFYVANERDSFGREVMESFADAYLEGRTPIPCVVCNKRFKFDRLLERARVFGAQRVATGHFARIVHDADTGLERLLRARDLDKDQSYFLFQLDQEQLRAAWFPLGELSKAEVRAEARKLGLATADKPESQEICFVPQGRYAEVVERIRPEARSATGAIVDREGRVLGTHRGIHHFTVGQRRGLGISVGRALYVTHIDAARQRVVVGEASELSRSELRVEAVSWIAGKAPADAFEARVHVRYRDAGTLGRVRGIGDRAEVSFEVPVRSAAPGQAAVFYDGEEVLGGGWIREARA